MASREMDPVLAGAEPSRAGIATYDPLTLGRSFYGAAMVGSGILQLVTGSFVRLVPKAARGNDASPVWPYLVGVILLLAGLAILSGRMTRPAGASMVVLLLVSFAFFQLPQALSNPWAGFMWTNPLKGLALIGGGALIAAKASRRERLVEALAATFFSLFFVVCGIQHFVYRDFVATLVPDWIPNHMFWTCFAGVALIAGGVGTHVRRTARLAASLSGLMVFLWVLMLHIPRAVALPAHAFETAGAFEALALSGIAFMLAGTFARRAPNGPAARS